MPETEALASYVVTSRLSDIPSDVVREAKRALLNFLGCAMGGSREPAVDTAIRALEPFSGERTAGLLARPERFDPLYASVINGISGHVYEYDDTTPMNYIHPTPPVASALFAFASANPTNGRDFIHAFLMGFEVESRIGNAVYPAHYNAGWHITSTAGVFGAAAAIGKLLRLSRQQMIWALGLASTQASGLREMFGSMAKSFHAGHAALDEVDAAAAEGLGQVDEEVVGVGAERLGHRDRARLERELGGPVVQEAGCEEQRADRDVPPALGPEGPDGLAGGGRRGGGEGGQGPGRYGRRDVGPLPSRSRPGGTAPRALFGSVPSRP